MTGLRSSKQRPRPGNDASEQAAITRGISRALLQVVGEPVIDAVVGETGGSQLVCDAATVGVRRWVESQAGAITALIVDEIDQIKARRALDARMQPEGVSP